MQWIPYTPPNSNYDIDLPVGTRVVLMFGRQSFSNFRFDWVEDVGPRLSNACDEMWDHIIAYCVLPDIPKELEDQR